MFNDNTRSDGEIKLIAGDDFTFSVNFYSKNNPVVFLEDDTAEMIIHGGDEEITIPAKSIAGNTVTFYLDSDLTSSLLPERSRISHVYTYCIRVKWAEQGQHTPIHRKTLTVKRC